MAAPKPRIALDLDGVVYDFHGAACYMMRHNFGYTAELSRESWTSWDWMQGQVHPDHWRWLWNQGVEEGLFRHGHTLKGSIDGVRELATLGDIAVVTSRPRSAIQDTLSWLAYNRLPITEVHIVGSGVPKTSCGDFALAVDDAVHNGTDYTSAGVPMLLIDKPWNQGVEDSPLLTRVFDWPDIVATAREVLR